MKNKIKFLVCACLFANIKAPTAIARYISGDESSTFRVAYESGISGSELAGMIETASGLPFAKLRVGLFVGTESLRFFPVAPEDAEVTLVVKEPELKVSQIIPYTVSSAYYIEYHGLKFEIDTRGGPAPSILEDLLSSCFLTCFKDIQFRYVPLNQNIIYVMQAVHNFSKANPGVEDMDLESYLGLSLMFSTGHPHYFIAITKRIFPEIDTTQDPQAIKNALIEQIQTNFDNPHTGNLRQIMRDAGVVLNAN